MTPRARRIAAYSAVALAGGLLAATLPLRGEIKDGLGKVAPSEILSGVNLIFGLWVFLPGAVAGLLLTHLVWIFLDPKRRLRRSARWLAALHVVTWTCFLVFNEPEGQETFARIHRERAVSDALSRYHHFLDGPEYVAARDVGTWVPGYTVFSLKLMAGPAVLFPKLVVVPRRHFGTPATRAESWVVAGFAFLLSGAFWISLGNGIALLRDRWSARRARRSLDPPSLEAGVDVEVPR
jgi:hypothetical protein